MSVLWIMKKMNPPQWSQFAPCVRSLKSKVSTRVKVAYASLTKRWKV